MESWTQGASAREDMPAAAAHECEAELPLFRPGQAANDTRMSQLARTIELEIIPRLMLAHGQAVEPPVKSEASHVAIVAEDVIHFAKVVLSNDEDTALARVGSLRERGIGLESIFFELLAPTARYLGELWNDDQCSFTDVTVGLGRLQRVLRELSPAFGRGVQHPAHGRRVLLLPSPGEQHTFGLVMVAEYFSRAGWDVTGGAWVDGADAGTLAANEWFDVVGFSLGAAVHLPQLAESIMAVRQNARNQDIAILVGGPLFGVNPEYAEWAGADGMTIDGREAPLLAEGLMASRIKTRHQGLSG